jgi:molecular chaperone GrpE
MEDMEDTVEISGEGAAKAAADTTTETEETNGGTDSVQDQDEQALQAELNETKDRLLRQVAEFQNYRRRTEQEKNMLVQAGKVQVVQQMLEIFDDFTRSLEAANQLQDQQESASPAYEKLKVGVEMVYEKFKGELGRLGVEPIEAVGKPFNENEHEALMQQPAPDNTEPGIVLEEIQKGYRMGNRVLRHSRVVVAS